MTPTPSRLDRWSRALLVPLAIAAALTLAACGTSTPGEGGGGGDGGPAPSDDPVAASLGELGVDTAPSPRRAPDGSELDDGAAPLGASAELGDPEEFTDESATHATAELVISRDVSSDPDTLHVEQIDGAQVTPSGTISFGSRTELADLTAEAPWASPDDEGSSQFTSLRAVTAGDLDDDGFDEIAAIYVDASDDVLKLDVFDDDAAGYATSGDALAPGGDVEGVALIALDGDGDGRDELIAAISYDDRVELTPLTGSGDSWSPDDAATVTLAQEGDGSTLYVRMSAGALDYDNGEELAIVVNEAFPSLATLYLFDDANAGRVELARRSVQANVGGIEVAEAADVSLADIDGDGLDEVVLAGATQLAEQCGDGFDALMIALDDATNDLAELGAQLGTLRYSNCPAFNSWERYFVFLATPDLDGDGVHEIAANQLVYQNFRDAAPFTEIPDVGLPADIFLNDNDDVGQYLSVATTAMIAADVTGDGRENLLLYRQNRETIPVWGVSAVSTIGDAGNGWAQLSEIAVPGDGFNSGIQSRPILVAANVDEDGPILKYGEGSYELVFTEPIVIAALAAPPCRDDIDQNVSACVTSFGQGSSETVDASVTVTVKASAFMGVETSVNVPFVGDVGTEFERTVTSTASAWAGTSYTVEKTVTYSSGPLEDAVVFTSVPYDVYRYEIVSHPDPDMIGNDVVIRLPREPVTMIAERGFFNDAVPEGSLRIDSNVFDHTPGDVDSYPSTSRKSTLLSRYGGLEFGPRGVGQGTGQTEQEIAVSNEIGVGGSLGIEYETSVKATSGVVFGGFSVGYGVEAALSFTSGSQTTFSGTVGSISAADYAGNAYQWGIFTYDQELADQEFAVINYWVP
jgi:hypothetical protein